MTTLIGSGPDQIPTNSMLGGMAFQDPDYVHVGSVVVDNTFSVGTSSPSYKVHINGTGSTIVGVEGTTDASFITRVNGVQALYLHSTVAASEVNELRNVPLNVSVNGAIRIKVDPTGWTSFYQGGSTVYIGSGVIADGTTNDSVIRWDSTNALKICKGTISVAQFLSTGDFEFLSTGYTKLATGTTAQRGSASFGSVRGNTSTSSLEFYSDGIWKNLSSPVGRNLLINGGFDVSQRLVNDSPFIQATTIGLGTGLERPLFDRWILQSSASGAFNVSVASAKQYGLNVPGIDRMAVLRKVGAGSQNCMLSQRIENGHNFQFINGQTFTLSFWAKSSAASDTIGLQIFEPIATNNTWSSVGTTQNTTSIFGSNAATTTSWQRYSFTFDTASVNGARGMMVTFYHISSVDAEEVYIAGVQLEEGIYATDYEIKSKEQILKECERYFCTFSSAVGTCLGANTAAVSYQFRTPMMATPNTIAGQNISWWSGASSNTASPSVGGITGNRFGGAVGYGAGTGTWGGFTTGAAIVLSGTQIIKFEAEL